LSSEDLKTQRTESGLTQCRKDKKGALMLGLKPMHLWAAAVELSMAFPGSVASGSHGWFLRLYGLP